MGNEALSQRFAVIYNLAWFILRRRRQFFKAAHLSEAIFVYTFLMATQLRVLALFMALIAFGYPAKSLAVSASEFDGCIQEVLNSAGTTDQVKQGTSACSEGLPMSDSVTRMTEIAKGWCRSLPTNFCLNQTVQCAKLLPDDCDHPTDVCGTGLKLLNGKCVCPETNRAAGLASECNSPVTCAAGLVNKNNICVCPGKTTAVTSASQCAVPKTDEVEEDPEFARRQIEGDLSKVTALSNQADKCCHDPESCGAPQKLPTNASGGGMGDLCAQMQKASDANAEANSKAAGICSSKFRTCTSAADEAIQKYNMFSDDCGNCSILSLYINAIARLQALKDSCNQLSAQVQLLGKQEIAGGSASAKSDMCKTASGFKTQSQGIPSGVPADTSVCAANPNVPGCSAAREGVALERRINGKDGYSHGEKDNSKFDPSAVSDYGGSPVSGVKGDTKNAGDHPTIPNGGGRFGGGDSNSGAVPGTAKMANAGAEGNGVNTDIMNGNRSGGYASMPSLGDANFETMNRRGGFQTMSANGGAGKNADLKKLMPPGFRYPATSGNPQEHILGKFDDLWQHIRDRMQEKCKLGLLEGCKD